MHKKSVSQCQTIGSRQKMEHGEFQSDIRKKDHYDGGQILEHLAKEFVGYLKVSSPGFI